MSNTEAQETPTENEASEENAEQVIVEVLGAGEIEKGSEVAEYAELESLGNFYEAVVDSEKDEDAEKYLGIMHKILRAEARLSELPEALREPFGLWLAQLQNRQELHELRSASKGGSWGKVYTTVTETKKLGGGDLGFEVTATEALKQLREIQAGELKPEESVLRDLDTIIPPSVIDSLLGTQRRIPNAGSTASFEELFEYIMAQESWKSKASGNVYKPEEVLSRIQMMRDGKQPIGVVPRIEGGAVRDRVKFHLKTERAPRAYKLAKTKEDIYERVVWEGKVVSRGNTYSPWEIIRRIELRRTGERGSRIVPRALRDHVERVLSVGL